MDSGNCVSYGYVKKVHVINGYFHITVTTQGKNLLWKPVYPYLFFMNIAGTLIKSARFFLYISNAADTHDIMAKQTVM